MHARSSARLALMTAFLAMSGCAPPHDESLGEVTAALGGTNRQVANGRQYQLYEPIAAVGGVRRPLVLFLHGFGGSLGSAEGYELDAWGQSEGFILAALEGTPCTATDCPDEIVGKNGWNNSITPNTRIVVDDVQYVLDVIADVKTQALVNKRRIYAVGQSNGAMMAYYLATQLPDTLAAVGAVSGAIGLDYQCDDLCLDDTCPYACNYGNPHVCKTIMMADPTGATGPISVAIIHGELDDHLYADGALGECSTTSPTAPGLDAVPLQDAVDFWVDANNCTLTQDFVNSNIDRTRRYGCDDKTEVVRWLVTGMKHEWQVNSSVNSFSTNNALWNFFKRHRLQP